jgi:hypothetical protein
VGATCPVWRVAKLAGFPAPSDLSTMVARYRNARTPDEKNIIFMMIKMSSFITELLPYGARWEHEGNLAPQVLSPCIDCLINGRM